MDSEATLHFFREITRIPRESGHEGPMREYLEAFARARGLACKVDKVGNVLITRPASPGKEGVPPLVLQAHQDMVCEKDAEVAFDFGKEPIDYVVEDGWMVAKHTTLGADDGIGIAACLALLDDAALCAGTLECLFTVSEETTMEGASHVKAGFFTGKTLVNLDSEDEGELFVGCAGGKESHATLSLEREPLPKGWVPLRITVGGGQGGHSGDDIDKGRLNAMAQLVRFLYTEMQYDYRLVSLEGGNKHNAICREACAVIAVPPDEKDEMLQDAAAFGNVLRSEFARADAGVWVKATREDAPCRSVLTEVCGGIAVATLRAIPHGVLAYSQEIPGLVQTSTNLAAVHTSEQTLSALCSHRSSVESELAAVGERLEAVCMLGGFEVEHTPAYPGWKPNLDSPILSRAVESYERVFHQKPKVRAIHAGLECGMFLRNIPSLDMISFGPTLRGVHAPGERLELASLDRFVAHLQDLVTHFS